MKKIVLRYGLVSGAVLMGLSAVIAPLCMNGTLDFSHSEVLGYSAMVLSFLLVFFGDPGSYRDNVAGGVISFGKAFQVGLLITLITCAMYVIAWEIIYFNFFPDFLDQYSAHVLAKMRASGESEAAIREDDRADGHDGEVLHESPLQRRHHLHGGLPGRAHRDAGLRGDRAAEDPARDGGVGGAGLIGERQRLLKLSAGSWRLASLAQA